MSNLKTRNAYRKKEATISYFYHFLAFIIVCINLILFMAGVDLSIFKNHKSAIDDILIWFNIAEVIMLIGLGSGLLIQLRSKYHFAYKNQKA